MICTYQIGLCWACREGGGLVLPAVPRSFFHKPQFLHKLSLPPGNIKFCTLIL